MLFMNGLVSSEVVPIGESDAANAAYVRLLRLVNILVLLEIVLGRERVFARLALEGPFTRVGPFMTFELDRLGEGLFTEAALVRLLAAMSRPHVIRQVGAALEDAIALFAGVTRRFVSTGNVIANVEAILELPVAYRA